MQSTVTHTTSSCASSDGLPGCIWFSKAVMDCVALATSAAAHRGCSAPQPADLLVAVLQHPSAAAVLSMLYHHNIYSADVIAVLKMGLLLHEGGASEDMLEAALINPLHDGTSLPEATKAVLQTSLRTAMNGGSDVVGLQHLFVSLCTDIIPLDVRYCPMAYALHQLLGENTAEQVLAQLMRSRAAQLKTANHAHDVVAATAPQHTKLAVQFLERLLPALQRSVDALEVLASYDKLGVYPNAAVRQRLQRLQNAHWSQNERHSGTQLKILLSSCTARDTPQIAQCLMKFCVHCSEKGDRLSWSQLLQLLRSLRRFQHGTHAFTFKTRKVVRPDDLWKCLGSCAQQGVPVYELLVAARCLRVLKLGTPAGCFQLACAISSAKQYTNRDKAVATHGLMTAADMDWSTTMEDRRMLLHSAGEAVKLHLPASVWAPLLTHLQRLQVELHQLRIRKQRKQRGLADVPDCQEQREQLEHELEEARLDTLHAQQFLIVAIGAHVPESAFGRFVLHG